LPNTKKDFDPADLGAFATPVSHRSIEIVPSTAESGIRGTSATPQIGRATVVAEEFRVFCRGGSKIFFAEVIAGRCRDCLNNEQWVADPKVGVD
jgi:hypothetical protein